MIPLSITNIAMMLLLDAPIAINMPISFFFFITTMKSVLTIPKVAITMTMPIKTVFWILSNFIICMISGLVSFQPEAGYPRSSISLDMDFARSGSFTRTMMTLTTPGSSKNVWAVEREVYATLSSCGVPLS